MIYDKLENLSRYKSLFPEIFEYLTTVDLNQLSLGKHYISSSLYVICNEYETQFFNTNVLENHRQNIDFHIILHGFERIGLAETFVSIKEPYSSISDTELVIGTPNFIDLKEGYFVILYPNEYHQPGVMGDSPQKVRKAVFKQNVLV